MGKYRLKAQCVNWSQGASLPQSLSSGSIELARRSAERYKVLGIRKPRCGSRSWPTQQMYLCRELVPFLVGAKEANMLRADTQGFTSEILDPAVSRCSLCPFPSLMLIARLEITNNAIQTVTATPQQWRVRRPERKRKCCDPMQPSISPST